MASQIPPPSSKSTRVNNVTSQSTLTISQPLNGNGRIFEILKPEAYADLRTQINIVVAKINTAVRLEDLYHENKGWVEYQRLIKILLNHDILSANKTIRKGQERIQLLEKSFFETDEHHYYLELSLEDSTREIEQTKVQLAALDEEKKLLEARLAQHEEAIITLSLQKDCLAQSTTDLREEVTSTKTARGLLQGENKALKQEAKNLEESNHSLEAQVQLLNREKETLVQVLSRTIDQMRQLESMVYSLGQEKSDLILAVAALEAEKDKSKASKESLEQQLVQRNDEVERLNQQLTATQNERDTMNQAHETLKAEAAEYARKLAAAKNESDSSSHEPPQDLNAQKEIKSLKRDIQELTIALKEKANRIAELEAVDEFNTRSQLAVQTKVKRYKKA